MSARRYLPWIVGLLAAAVLAALYGHSLVSHVALALDPTVFNDDARQQITPFYRYEDGSLTDDYINDYYLAALPTGYRLLYTLAGLLGVAAPLSKVVVYVLLLVTLAGVAMTARKMGGAAAAWFAAAICLGSELYLARLGGGLPRAFAFPILACMLAALAYGRARLLAVLVAVGAAFYPVTAVIGGMALAYFLVLLPQRDRGEARSWSMFRRWRLLALTALATVALVAPSAIAARPFGPILTPEAVDMYPEIGPGGRYGSGDRAPFAGFFDRLEQVAPSALEGSGEAWWKEGRRWLDEKGRFDKEPPRRGMLYDLVLGLTIAGWLSLAARRSSARRVLGIALAAFVGHAIARVIPPFFYLPQRYVMYPVPPMVAVMVPTALAGLAGYLRRSRRQWQPALVLAGSTLLLALVGGHGDRNAGLNTRVVVPGGIYQAIADLPKDALVAGWPWGPMDNVPYVTRRRAFVTYETHQAFHAAYAIEMRKRMRALMDAYFATDPAPLRALRDDFGVTHLLLDLRHLRGKAPRYFKPFDAWAAEAAARGPRDGGTRLLAQVDDAVIFHHEPLVIIDLARLSPRPGSTGRGARRASDGP